MLLHRLMAHGFSRYHDIDRDMKGADIFHMKKIFKIFVLSLLALIFCAVAASCGASDSADTNGTPAENGSADVSNPAETTPPGNVIITETTSDDANAEIPALSVGYLTGEAYNNGSFAEEAIRKTADFSNREDLYMVVDLKIRTLGDNSGNQSVRITARSSDASVLYMMVQDAPTGKIEAFGNREGYHLFYSISAVGGEEKSVRMILKLVPHNNQGNADVSISISGTDGMSVRGKTGASTTFVLPLSFTFTLENDEYIVSDFGDADDTAITIPSTHMGKPVTGIGDSAFEGCGKLTSVVIPDSVTSIGFSAFKGCNALTSITLPFAGNTASGTSNTHFGYIFGASTSADHGAYVPSSLKTVVLTSASSIDALAFEGCTGLTSVVIPDSVTSIGSSAFKDCNGLTSITLPFVGNTADGTTNTHFGYIFGASASADHANLVPPSLKTVVLTSASSIGDYAFNVCKNLTSIVLPDTLTSIGLRAFLECNSLTEISVHESNAFYCSENGILFSKDQTNLVCYPIGKAEKTYTIPDGVTVIGSEAFAYCKNLTDIVIPDSVTSIGSCAFFKCNGLTNITIPNSVTDIGGSAFERCSALKSVTLGSGVTGIGSYAFCECISLTSVTIGGGVTTIGIGVFYDCRKLTSIRFDDAIAKWKSISFDIDWDRSTGNYIVTCSDGTITKYGVITYL